MHIDCFHTLIACLTQQCMVTGWGRLRVFVFRPTLLMRCRALVVLLASQKGNSAALQHYAGTLLQVCAQGSLCDMYRCSDDFVG